ncbi:MAG: hypothetical protein IH987_14915 [Planctomycetes bacterium]|nr:hypothetical protein [Planctomycetota bacterium]
MAEPVLMRFTENDQFLRRVRFHDHVNKRGLLLWRAFKDGDPQMSLTFRDETLKANAELDAYHAYFCELVGEHLAAILWFTFRGLTREISPPLEPRYCLDANDLVYGHLHCSCEAPRDKPHMELLAKLVNDAVHAGIARRYEKRSA